MHKVLKIIQAVDQVKNAKSVKFYTYLDGNVILNENTQQGSDLQ